MSGTVSCCAIARIAGEDRRQIRIWTSPPWSERVLTLAPTDGPV